MAEEVPASIPETPAVIVGGAANTAVSTDVLPEYLMQVPEGVRTGQELMEEYSQPSLEFLKVVQGIGPLSEEFQKGDVLIMPEKKRVMVAGQSLTVTPLFVFPEFTLRFAYKASPTRPVKERTYDPKSELAARCEPWSRNQREIEDKEHPGHKLTYRRNAVVSLWCWELERLLHVTFGGGEDETWREWKKLIDARGANKPINAGRYKLEVGVHPRTYKSDDRWMGFNFSNDPRPWATQDEFVKLMEMQDELAARHAKGATAFIQDNAPEGTDLGTQFGG